MVLRTKYQCSRTKSFRQEDFLMFPYISLCKTCDSWGGDIFGPRGIILNKLGRGLLGDATYQILMLYVLWFHI